MLLKSILYSTVLSNSFIGNILAFSMASSSEIKMDVDPIYPGTAVQRMHAIRERVKGLTSQQLSDDWEVVRRNVLWAGGLKDLPTAR